MIDFYPITPMAKPRMTRADAITMKKLRSSGRLSPKERKRASILSDWLGFVDECRIRHVFVPECNAHVVFLLPMPKSWSVRKRNQMRGQPHRGKKDKARKNDVDNLEKALLDAVYGEDSGVWDLRATKFWWDFGGIFVMENEALYIRVPFDFSVWHVAAVRGLAAPEGRKLSAADGYARSLQ